MQFLVSFVGAGHGGLYKALTKENRKVARLTREGDKTTKFIDFGFERGQVVGLGKESNYTDSTKRGTTGQPGAKSSSEPIVAVTSGTSNNMTPLYQ